jgi:hypothetical protein
MLTFFTPLEVNSILPDVQRMLLDLGAKKNQIASERKVLEELALRDGGEEVELARQKIRVLMEEIERIIGLLEEMGCMVRHIDEGIVDFPALRYGKQVYLCWRLGESEVSYWHDMEKGYAGRSRITVDEITNAYV